MGPDARGSSAGGFYRTSGRQRALVRIWVWLIPGWRQALPPSPRNGRIVLKKAPHEPVHAGAAAQCTHSRPENYVLIDAQREVALMWFPLPKGGVGIHRRQFCASPRY